MKNKFTYFLLFLALTQAISCQKQSLLTDVDPIENQITLEGQSNLNNENKENTVWFSFEPIINSPEWINSEDIDWRLSQIQIPKEQLSVMPTSVLLNLCLDYPFYLDYTASNECRDGISRLMLTFNGFKELAKRDDVLPLMASYLDSIDIPTLVKESDKKNNTREDVLHVNYTELLISRIASIQKNKKFNQLLEKSATRIRCEKSRYKDVFGNYSMSSSEELRRSLSNENNSNIDLSTTFGLSVSATIREEQLSKSERKSMNTYYRLRHPLASFVSTSTSTYNCHSYAWHMSEGGSPCWINGSMYDQPELDGTLLSYSDNVGAYWSDGLYSRTTSYKAKKIYYCRGDHSAIKSNESGKYESKWGMGPLMKHSPTDCPSIYNPSYRQYFKETSLLLDCSVGIREVYVNESCTYTAVDVPDGVLDTYSWEVIDDKNGDNVLGTFAIITNVTSRSAVIKFTKIGNYYINLYLSHPNRGRMAYNWAAYVIPNE